MSLVLDADSEYLSWSGSPFWASSDEWTIMAWVKRTSAVDGDIFGITDNGDEAYNNCILRILNTGATYDHSVVLQSQDRRMDTGAGPTGGWDHVALTYLKNGSRIAYRNGSASSTISTNMTEGWANGQGFDALYVGRFNPNGYGQHNGRMKIAHCAVWNKQLSGAEISGLYGGDNPTAVQTASLKFYVPLLTDKTVTTGGITLTDNGTLTYDGADNPTVDAAGGGSNIIRGVKGMSGGMQTLSGGTQ